MRFKLVYGVLVLAFLVAFACNSKKPSEFTQVTFFSGTVTDGAGQPLENLLVTLTWSKSQNCTCGAGDVISCVSSDTVIINQPTNQAGNYAIEVRWKDFGFLFDQSFPCQIPFALEAEKTPYSGTADAVKNFTMSQQSRSAGQVNNFQLP